MSDRISACFPGLALKLQRDRGSGIEDMMAQSSDLKSEFAQCIRAHLIRAEGDVVDMRNGILYLNLLNETRAMVRHSFALLQDQSELFRTTPKELLRKSEQSLPCRFSDRGSFLVSSHMENKKAPYAGSPEVTKPRTIQH